MHRKVYTHVLTRPEDFKKKLLQWSASANPKLWLDSNGHQDKHSSYEALLALGAQSQLKANATQAFDQLKAYRQQTQDWIFGYLTYDLKNEVEALHSANFDGLEFPDLFFFQPEKLFLIKENRLEMRYLSAVADQLQEDFQAIQRVTIERLQPQQRPQIHLRIPKEEYMQKVEQLLHHIHRGDIYEANFCQECYAEAAIDPLSTYQRLNTVSRPPFAAFLRYGDLYALCASPERYLKKSGSRMLSQPIKGTAPRSADPNEDAAFAKALQLDPKERSENIMITDLVRNDLSRTALRGSVQVSELCGIYSFPQVHQMISTVESQLGPEVDPVMVLRTTFPMGSMTGAPKVRAMEIIEALEETRRGLYSGAIGYMDPDGNFDFNVVIRSLLYNAAKSYLSFSVGSAITARSVAEKEYAECVLKAKGIRQALGDL
ncbi:aminodeoxychorismate synthase component I [Croceiramulus getboli]|nr:aminodeoxychorismate synthase component I [Flavobacteriaceae bacterium YJPT1-3]